MEHSKPFRIVFVKESDLLSCLTQFFKTNCPDRQGEEQKLLIEYSGKEDKLGIYYLNSTVQTYQFLLKCQNDFRKRLWRKPEPENYSLTLCGSLDGVEQKKRCLELYQFTVPGI